jgi:hypothetical protein
MQDGPVAFPVHDVAVPLCENHIRFDEGKKRDETLLKTIFFAHQTEHARLNVTDESEEYAYLPRDAAQADECERYRGWRTRPSVAPSSANTVETNYYAKCSSSGQTGPTTQMRRGTRQTPEAPYVGQQRPLAALTAAFLPRFMGIKAISAYPTTRGYHSAFHSEFISRWRPLKTFVPLCLVNTAYRASEIASQLPVIRPELPSAKFETLNFHKRVRIVSDQFFFLAVVLIKEIARIPGWPLVPLR